MSQITLWKSIKGLSSQFPSFASLLRQTFLPVAEGVSPIFLFLLSFFMKPAPFIQALAELEYDTHSSPLDLGHARDQVLVTHKSCFINANGKRGVG